MVYTKLIPYTHTRTRTRTYCLGYVYRRVRVPIDAVMNTDRLFLHSLGLANRKYQDKHVLYAAAGFDSYITTIFPTLYDAFTEFSNIDDAKGGCINV